MHRCHSHARLVMMSAKCYYDDAVQKLLLLALVACNCSLRVPAITQPAMSACSNTNKQQQTPPRTTTTATTTTTTTATTPQQQPQPQQHHQQQPQQQLLLLLRLRLRLRLQQCVSNVSTKSSSGSRTRSAGKVSPRARFSQRIVFSGAGMRSNTKESSLVTGGMV